MAQYIEINNCWNSTRFCCPVCGDEVYTDDGGPTESPCEHVLFSWIDAVGDYDNLSPRIRELQGQYEADNGFDPLPCDEDFQDALPDAAVLFALTHRGMACGPTELTVVHAIEFPVEDEL